MMRRSCHGLVCRLHQPQAQVGRLTFRPRKTLTSEIHHQRTQFLSTSAIFEAAKKGETKKKIGTAKEDLIESEKSEDSSSKIVEAAKKDGAKKTRKKKEEKTEAEPSADPSKMPSNITGMMKAWNLKR